MTRTTFAALWRYYRITVERCGESIQTDLARMRVRGAIRELRGEEG